MSRMRILLVLPFAPRLDAPHGGGRVLAQLLVRLAEQHDLALLYAQAAHEPPIDPALRGRCALAEAFTRADPAAELSQAERWRRRARLLHGWWRGEPMQVSDWHIPALSRRLGQLAARWQPDLVQIEYQIMGQYLAALGSCPAPRVLTVHDLGAATAHERAERASGIGRVVALLDARAWQRYERAVLRQVQAAVVFTERDRLALAQQAGTTPIECIPFGAELPICALDSRGGDPPSLLFVGNFVHAPNADAATRLVSAIFPLVRARHPNARLVIVGDQPPPALRQAASEQVVVTGRVPDVTPYLDQAAVVVAPLRTGGGMRVKVLEALAAGKALVASPLAVAGLSLRHGEQALLAESDAEFAAAASELLADPARRAELASRARAWACAQLGWDAPLARYGALYERVTDRGPSPRQAILPEALDGAAQGRGAQ